MTPLAILALAKRFAPLAGMLALAIFAAIQFAEARHYRKTASACATARASDQAAWDAAAAQYRASVTAREAEQTHAKEVADEKLDDALARARDAAARYVSVRRQEGGSGTGQPASKSATTGEPYSPSDVSELVPVSADDIEICTINTARLLNAKAWAEGK